MPNVLHDNETRDKWGFENEGGYFWNELPKANNRIELLWGTECEVRQHRMQFEMQIEGEGGSVSHEMVTTHGENEWKESGEENL